MNQGQQNQVGLINSMLGWNQQGLSTANQARQQPFNNWNQFVNPATSIAGLGGTNSQNMPGNQLLGAIGGAQLGNSLYTQYTKPPGT